MATNCGSLSTSDSSSSSGVESACGGCGGSGAQGDACTYMSQIDAACQKAMAPYTDSCSTCGGSGVQGGGSGGGGGGGSSSGSSNTDSLPEIYTLSYIFDADPDGLPAAGHIKFDSISNYPMTATSYTFRVNTWIPDAPYYETVTVNTPALYMGINFSTITKIAVSNVDRHGQDSSIILNTLTAHELFRISKASNFVNVEYLSKRQDAASNCTVLSVKFKVSSGDLEDGDIVNIVVFTVVVAGGVDHVACSACRGTGLENGTGGIPGLIMAVFNGSAGFAGVDNVDIYGRKIE
jgi:hypothetical protein